MSDNKLCPNCAKDGKVGIMERKEELDLGLAGSASNTYYECDRCGSVQEDKGGKNFNGSK